MKTLRDLYHGNENEARNVERLDIASAPEEAKGKLTLQFVEPLRCLGEGRTAEA